MESLYVNHGSCHNGEKVWRVPSNANLSLKGCVNADFWLLLGASVSFTQPHNEKYELQT